MNQAGSHEGDFRRQVTDRILFVILKDSSSCFVEYRLLKGKGRCRETREVTALMHVGEGGDLDQRQQWWCPQDSLKVWE